MYKKVHVTHSVSSHIVYNHHHCIAKYLVVSVHPVQFYGARKTQACLLNRSDKPVLFTYDMPNQLQVNTRKRRRITADDLLDALKGKSPCPTHTMQIRSRISNV